MLKVQLGFPHLPHPGLCAWSFLQGRWLLPTVASAAPPSLAGVRAWVPVPGADVSLFTVRLLREELQLLQEQGSYVGEVVRAMDKKKVLVKVWG